MRQFVELLGERNVSKKLQRLIFDHCLCFGPKRLGSNLIINKFTPPESSFFRTVESIIGQKLIPDLEMDAAKQAKIQKDQSNNNGKLEEMLETYKISLKELNNALINGFDLASTAGPLMDEPMQGAVFILEDLRIDTSVGQVGDCGPIGGQIMSTTKNLCKHSFLNSDPRVVEGMYMCSLQASPETYGVVYSIINKFRGSVIKEEI